MKIVLSIFTGALAAVVVGGLVLMHVHDKRVAEKKAQEETASTMLQLSEVYRNEAVRVENKAMADQVRAKIADHRASLKAMLKNNLITPEAAEKVTSNLESAAELVSQNWGAP